LAKISIFKECPPYFTQWLCPIFAQKVISTSTLSEGEKVAY